MERRGVCQRVPNPHRGGLWSRQTGLLVLLCGPCMLLAQEDRSPNDAMEQRLAAMAAQLVNLRAKYRFKVNDLPWRHVNLTWDIPGDRVNGTTVFGNRTDAEQPMIHTHVKNHEFSWYCYPEYGNQEAGTWGVNVRAAKDGLPSAALNADMGTQYLLDLLTPYTLRPRTRQYIEDRGLTVRVEETRQPSGDVVRRYDLEKNGQVCETIAYTLDVADGVRIKRVQTAVRIGDQMQKSCDAEFTDFRKDGDLWFPWGLRQTLWNADGSVGLDIRFEFEHVAPNVELREEDFVYVPSYGSRVFDHVRGITYRVGQADPMGPLGSDASFKEHLSERGEIQSDEQSAVSPDPPEDTNQPATLLPVVPAPAVVDPPEKAGPRLAAWGLLGLGGLALAALVVLSSLRRRPPRQAEAGERA